MKHRPLIVLHLEPSSELTRQYGKRLRDAGASYNEARGHAYRRYVQVPWRAQNAPLMEQLIAEFGGTAGSRRKGPAQTTIIFRDFPRIRTFSCSAHTLADALSQFRKAARAQKAAGTLEPVLTAHDRLVRRHDAVRDRIARAQAAIEGLEGEIRENCAELMRLKEQITQSERSRSIRSETP